MALVTVTAADVPATSGSYVTGIGFAQSTSVLNLAINATVGTV